MRDSEGIMGELAKLARKMERIERTLHLVLRTVMDEDYGLPPWHDLPEPKMRQVERVFDFMMQHPASSVFNAVRRSYTWLDGGYGSMRGLYVRCRKCELDLYVRERRAGGDSVSVLRKQAV